MAKLGYDRYILIFYLTFIFQEASKALSLRNINDLLENVTAPFTPLPFKFSNDPDSGFFKKQFAFMFSDNIWGGLMSRRFVEKISPSGCS